MSISRTVCVYTLYVGQCMYNYVEQYVFMYVWGSVFMKVHGSVCQSLSTSS